MTRTVKRQSPLLFVFTLGLGLPLAFNAGCKKEEPPPPPPAPAPVATPAAPVEIKPEPTPAPTATVDAGPEDAGIDAGAKKPGASATAGFMKCCTALEQNAESAPEPNKTYLKNAAGLCKGMVGAGAAQPMVLSTIRNTLKGAGLPTACK